MFILLVSCSEPNLDELKLDYSSEKARQACLIDIQGKLSEEQWQKLQMAIGNTKTKALREGIHMNKNYSSEAWGKRVEEVTREALHGKSVKELINE